MIYKNKNRTKEKQKYKKHLYSTFGSISEQKVSYTLLLIEIMIYIIHIEGMIYIDI